MVAVARVTPEWHEICGTLAQAGQLQELAGLLDRLTCPTQAGLARFYRGRIALAQAEYAQAIAQFHQAGLLAPAGDQTLLREQSLVWEAYCQCFRGNYRVAEELVEMVGATPAGESLRGMLFFVRGLIASYIGTLPAAQRWFEQAHDCAIHCHDRWLESRCCVNLAAIATNQGLIELAVWMIRRVRELHRDQEAPPSPAQLVQLENIDLYCRRMSGDLEAALAQALPLPAPRDDGSVLYAGWLALSAAMIAADLDDFAQAWQCWQHADQVLGPVRDDGAVQAELLWEAAWLSLRQGRLDVARQQIKSALTRITDQTSLDCFHVLAINALIDLRLGDFGTVSRDLRRAVDHTRAINHRIGLVSVLIHVADYHLRFDRPEAARSPLAEALMLMREYRLYGAFYWHPEVMARLCALAMQEDIWGDQALDLAAGLLAQHGLSDLAIEGRPEDMWGDFAASLAARRLACGSWRAFAPLLADRRPQVRRRAQQVLLASGDSAALALLEQPNHRVLVEQPVGGPDDLQPALRAACAPGLRIATFGRFEVMVDGQPLSARAAGTRKALLVFGALLLAGEHGLESAQLAVLPWPDLPEQKRGRSLHVTIHDLRKTLRGALAGVDPIAQIGGRYFLLREHPAIWWDWAWLRAVTRQNARDEQVCQEVRSIYAPAFMDRFFDLLPAPTACDQATAARRDMAEADLRDMAAAYEDEAQEWYARITSDERPADDEAW